MQVKVSVRRALGKERLARISADLERRAYAAGDAWAQNVVSGAQRRAPIRTGHLRDSIDATDQGGGEHTVRVGAFYGVYVEYGTRRMAAQPYFRPAVDSARAKFEDDLRRLIRG